MKKLFFIILAIINFISFVEASAYFYLPVEWNRTDYTFENVKRNQLSIVRFTYTNKSDKSIYLRSVESSYKLNDSNAYKLKIAYNTNIVSSGATGYVDVAYMPNDTQHFFKDSIYVVFNDYTRQLISVSGGSAFRASKTLPILLFNDTFHDFGIITGSKALIHAFKLVNKGDDYLSIKNAFGTCGCVEVATYTKEPIAPGEIGYITVRLNPTKAKETSVKKYIYVESNAGSKKLLVMATIKRTN